jgi:polyphosphate kinase
VHLSTGNYNAATAHLYTDMGLLTANEEIAADTTDLFNYLTGYSAKSDYGLLMVSPVNLRSRFELLVRREIEHARDGRRARLIFKTNALVDPATIRLLYLASQAGVQVDLLVRGVCCLRPGLPGYSDNIRVISVVGRFLEHSRIYSFENGGDREIYIGSADLMSRNINRRVETVFPLRSPALVRSVAEVLDVYLSDNVKAREMRSDGSYMRVKAKGHPVNAQEWLIARARAAKRSAV